MSTIEVEEDIDGGALPVGLATSTIEVEEDVDGGSPRGRCRQVWQRPPLMMKMISMAGPLRALPADPTISTTEVEDDKVSIPPCV
jgi:hypothetical protein